MFQKLTPAHGVTPD